MMGKAEKERKYEKLFWWVSTRLGIENSNKIAKKLENTIIPSSQAKIGWERLRKIENKINRSDVFLPDP